MGALSFGDFPVSVAAGASAQTDVFFMAGASGFSSITFTVSISDTTIATTPQAGSHSLGDGDFSLSIQVNGVSAGTTSLSASDGGENSASVQVTVT